MTLEVGMHGTVSFFVATELPVLFLFAVTTIFLRRRLPSHWLPRLLTFQFPVIAAGSLGLPLWALWQLLQLR